RTGQTTCDEQGDKADGKQQRRGEADTSTVKRAGPVKGFDGGRDGNRGGERREGEAGVGVHATDKHVMSPDHKAQSADSNGGADHGFVSEDRFARKDREQM